jgi:large subunit ribosomal protein L29
MKASELRGKSVAELDALLVEKNVEMVNNKRSLAAGELPNPRVVSNLRRDIARIHSCLTEARNANTSKGDA